MAGLSAELHAPFDGARLASIFECEEDMRTATRSAHWPFDETQWRAWMSEPGLRAFFVTIGGEDAGHFALRARGADRHLSWLLLRSRFRGGRGRDLLGVAKAEALALSARQLTLNVMRDNPRAFHLYRACGFAPLHEADGKVTMVADLGCGGPGQETCNAL